MAEPKSHTSPNGVDQQLHTLFAGNLSKIVKDYSARTGGCNIILANHLIDLVTPYLPAAGKPLRILDNACGPLVLTEQCLLNPIITEHNDVHISAVDLSEDFITNNQETIAANASWKTNGKLVDTAVMNGMDLKYPDATFDASFTSLAIFAFPDPIKGASELHRSLKSGGVAALTSWKYVGWVPLLHAVERLIKPNAEPTRFPFLEPWYHKGKLEATMRAGGFSDVIEGDVGSMALWESVDEAAKWISETLKLIVGQGWTEGEKERMEEGLRDVMGGEQGREWVKREGGKVGFDMVAWTAVCWK
ncbi:hypothetical protein MMC28_010691 [Mycoblastus sanguinarius]|nr:hypothetical protein [Mycoblastus sanguinarius]